MEKQDQLASKTYSTWSDFTWRLDELGIDLYLDKDFNLKASLPLHLKAAPVDVRVGFAQFHKDLHRFILETDLNRAKKTANERKKPGISTVDVTHTPDGTWISPWETPHPTVGSRDNR